MAKIEGKYFAYRSDYSGAVVVGVVSHINRAALFSEMVSTTGARYGLNDVRVFDVFEEELTFEIREGEVIGFHFPGGYVVSISSDKPIDECKAILISSIENAKKGVV